MSLKEQVINDMKAAMKAKDKATLGTIRMLTAAIKQIQDDKRRYVRDADVLTIVAKMIKQRKDAAEQFAEANRMDLQVIELAEIVIIEKYLPAQLSTEEVTAVVQTIIAETGANGMQDMGKVMGLTKAKVAGQADMGQVSQIVKAALS
ncbi:Transamidase GatB domain protein [hydrothermal vent metagenome]|uniref:Transamidase GatB domain protein n=1 Tax=hydrothermal vent metagenome TaxID=652676 RepID=A0A3B0W3X5_9ZZZZ